MNKWKVYPTHWGEGHIVRECTEDDPEWKMMRINGTPHVRHKTEKPLSVRQAEELVKKLNA